MSEQVPINSFTGIPMKQVVSWPTAVQIEVGKRGSSVISLDTEDDLLVTGTSDGGVSLFHLPTGGSASSPSLQVGQLFHLPSGGSAPPPPPRWVSSSTSPQVGQLFHLPPGGSASSTSNSLVTLYHLPSLFHFPTVWSASSTSPQLGHFLPTPH